MQAHVQPALSSLLSAARLLAVKPMHGRPQKYLGSLAGCQAAAGPRGAGAGRAAEALGRAARGEGHICAVLGRLPGPDV